MKKPLAALLAFTSLAVFSGSPAPADEIASDAGSVSRAAGRQSASLGLPPSAPLLAQAGSLGGSGGGGGSTGAAPARFNARRQDFKFSNMDIRSAFKGIASAGGVDIVVSPTVTGQSVALELTGKTWQEALMILCQMYNLKYLVEDNYLYVQTMAEYNKTTVENATAMQQSGSLAPLMRDVIKLKNAKAKDLEASVRGLLSTRGRINVVERNNALLIFDTRQNIEEVRAAVRDLDVETYQVNISAQLITVDSDALREIGVDWQVGSGQINPLALNPGRLPTSSNDFSVLGGSNHGSQANSTGGSGTGGGAGGDGGGEAAAAVGGVAGATTQFAFGLLNGNLAIAVANLLRTNKGEVLAKPQITTLDNTEARIFMGEQVPIRVLDANGRQAIQLQDAGTSLTVTPHVTSDGRILLDLNPEKNSFRVDNGAGGVVLQKQMAKTSVVVNDGETVVIAGLTTKTEDESESGVPVLKDIPILGYLFKHTAKRTRKSDLIIFVTPHIVRGKGEPDLARLGAPSLGTPTSNQPNSSGGVWGDAAGGSAPAAPASAPSGALP